ncbi:hypothetical protein THASP1DRAFT_32526 [Thamnocephalis sphaerospora]|uniref:Uncharacterized protein n=1 Tax=Thamnocephalis sphaerospora TaxID=78915 RepID=A0A4P9XIV6_9FUNG|nr:hypothetical protein THASP1DRAFT_32526 [Thamnocephalis sphaerospora]|eukprot:RKP05638.1 hypothetical protein THASP1DRAFT_32526 [Thamnocephalis sphaerospora]
MVCIKSLFTLTFLAAAALMTAAAPADRSSSADVAGGAVREADPSGGTGAMRNTEPNIDPSSGAGALLDTEREADPSGGGVVHNTDLKAALSDALDAILNAPKEADTSRNADSLREAAHKVDSGDSAGAARKVRRDSIPSSDAAQFARLAQLGAQVSEAAALLNFQISLRVVVGMLLYLFSLKVEEAIATPEDMPDMVPSFGQSRAWLFLLFMSNSHYLITPEEQAEVEGIFGAPKLGGVLVDRCLSWDSYPPPPRGDCHLVYYESFKIMFEEYYPEAPNLVIQALSELLWMYEHPNVRQMNL